jgi:hypothetical protein
MQSDNDQARSTLTHQPQLINQHSDQQNMASDQEMSSVGTNKEAAALNREHLYIQAKEIALKIQSQIDSKIEPVDLLAELNQLLNVHHQEIQTHLALDPAFKKDFIKVVLKQTADKLLQEKQLQQPGV